MPVTTVTRIDRLEQCTQHCPSPNTQNTADLISFGLAREAVFFHAINQSAAADVEKSRGIRLIAIELFERAADKFAFNSFEADTFLR